MKKRRPTARVAVGVNSLSLRERSMAVDDDDVTLLIRC